MKRTNTVKEVRFKLDPVVSSGKIAIATLSLLIVATTVSCIGLGVILFQSINRYNDAYSSSVAALDSASNNYTNNSSQPVYITQVEYENSSIPNFDRFVNLPGANAYFLHTVRSVDQDDIIESMRLANIKLVRIFIRTLGGNSEGSGSNSLEDYEVGQIGNFDESKLAPIDELMYKTYKAGMKLVIALHDRWELGHCGDVYSIALNYATSTLCLNSTFALNPSEFYNNPWIIKQFDRRLVNILNHQNPYFGNKPWSSIPQAIHAFDVQNEPQVGSLTRNSDWMCARASVIRAALGVSSPILVSTGGGADFSDSLSNEYFSCSNIDLISIHSKSSDSIHIQEGLSFAANMSRSKLLMLEFGVLPTSSQAQIISSTASLANSLSIPWIMYLVSKPSNSDFAVYTDTPPSWSALSLEAANAINGTNITSTTSTTSGGLQLCGSALCLSDWQFCTVNSQCSNGCCSNQYSNDYKMKCTPSGTICGSPLPSPACNGLCYGDWVFCALNSDCANNCCSNEFSTSDGKMKCTPKGSHCGSPFYSITSSIAIPASNSTTTSSMGSLPTLTSGGGDFWSVCQYSSDCLSYCCSKSLSSDGLTRCVTNFGSEQCVSNRTVSTSLPSFATATKASSVSLKITSTVSNSKSAFALSTFKTK